MTNPLDEHFLDCLAAWDPTHADADEMPGVEQSVALAYFDAQARSRHTDFAARWLHARGEGYYTIGSAGHESNAAIAMALRPTDPALLHYRSGGFYMARGAQVRGATPVRDVLLGIAGAIDDPISGGRHKVFGHPDLNVIPQTSTIGSHLPRALGVAFALGQAERLKRSLRWPADSVVVASFGDASANHSTVTGALNAAAYSVRRGADVPLLIVCEDNGIGISTKTPDGWIATALSRYAEFQYVSADGANANETLLAAQNAVARVRASRRPTVFHLHTVRFLGHAGSDVELAYRSPAEVAADYARDPLWAAARLILQLGVMDVADVREHYEGARRDVDAQARAVCGARRLESATAVVEPLIRAHPEAVGTSAARRPTPESRSLAKQSPEELGPLSLAQSINAALADVLALRPEALVFGEDVAVKGGVYGVTRGLSKRFGRSRVFDTLLDEQTILGLALGTALSGLLPIPEIQYLAYLHNAEDQLRGEAATLAFFSAGQYHNGMVVRIAGLAYQRGFGGHFHNDNSVTVLRDIPGLVLVVPSNAGDAPGLLRTCVALASEEGRVCVFLEPIALYHARDLHAPGDDLWSAPYDGLGQAADGELALGDVRTYLEGRDLLLVTFGNGVPMSLRVSRRLAAQGIDCTVLDLRWLAPLPTDQLLDAARHFDRVLVVDETRRSGGVSEGVLAVLSDEGFDGLVGRVASVDSFIPLGPAADAVLLSEQDVFEAATRLMQRT